MSAMIPASQYARAHAMSTRQVQRYAVAGRLTGATRNGAGEWLIPAGAPDPRIAAASPVTTTPRDVGPVRRELVPEDAPVGRPLPPGLWPLDDVAAYWDTTRGRIRRMGRDGLLVIGPYGRDGVLRVYVAG